MDQADPGFDERRGRRARVTLNGAPVDWCITADEEEGFVIVSVRRPDGGPALDASRNRITQRLDGVVKITLPAP